MKLLLPAKDIPINSVVIKKTGDKRHVLLDTITIRGMDLPPILPPKDMLFMVSLEMSYSIFTVDKNTELLWVVEEHELREYLQHKRA